MRPHQREGGLAMIEGHILPAGCIMARGTYRSELSVVCILGSMTGIAIRGCALEHAIRVTDHTLNVLVLPSQWEGSPVVIEGHVFPAAGLVAGTTIRTELTAVWVF